MQSQRRIIRSRWSRIALFVALMLPGFVLVFGSSTRAQPPGFPRGSRPGGITRPPTIPGFPGGRPGGSGFSGISGSIPRIPTPGMPSGGISGRFPGSGVSGRFPGSGISGRNPGSGITGRFPGSGITGRTPGGLGGGFEHVWTCSNCRSEIGRSKSGIDRPSFSHCPNCNVKFINGGIGMSRPGSTFRPSNGNSRVSRPANPGWNEPPRNPGGNVSRPTAPPPTKVVPPKPTPPPTNDRRKPPAVHNNAEKPLADSGSSKTHIWVIGGGVVLLGAGILVTCLVLGANGRSGRRSAEDYDMYN